MQFVQRWYSDSSTDQVLDGFISVLSFINEVHCLLMLVRSFRWSFNHAIQNSAQLYCCLLLIVLSYPFYLLYFTAEHRKLQGVAEQLIKFESLRQNFEKRFVSHLNKIIVLQVGGTLLWVD